MIDLVIIICYDSCSVIPLGAILESKKPKPIKALWIVSSHIHTYKLMLVRKVIKCFILCY